MHLMKTLNTKNRSLNRSHKLSSANMADTVIIFPSATPTRQLTASDDNHGKPIITIIKVT